uniref:Alpha-amylase n=1 Tax=Desulfobacca acetoxidans TaxID=60893 RepID=A0A7C3SL85_9BACT
MPAAALIYNLFPLLVGPIPRWEEHLDRIAAMGFNWVFLNPLHPPGLSGSLYAVKDYFSINPQFWPESGEDPEVALVRFIKKAEQRGLKVMLDLVINHTAIDSPLVKEHPEWYAKNEDGSIKHPGAIDPGDATKVTVWGDLAELAYWPVPDPEGLLNFWAAVLSKYLSWGFRGFRADAAYKIPGWFWRPIIEGARGRDPELQFFAETLGCRLEELAQLADAGFDYICNSSKWWDFQAEWCLEQYNRFRHLAPSISFPETHDTERVAAESGSNPAVARQRYLFAAFFSTGLMIPVGFEFGFKKRLHVVKTRPEDWETPTYDLTDFITRVNRLKLGCPVLVEEGPVTRLSPRKRPVVVLLKSRDQGKGRVVAVINASPKVQKANLQKILDFLGEPETAWQDLTPEANPLRPEQMRAFLMAPWDMKLFFNPEGTPFLRKKGRKA